MADREYWLVKLSHERSIKVPFVTQDLPLYVYHEGDMWYEFFSGERLAVSGTPDSYLNATIRFISTPDVAIPFYISEYGGTAYKHTALSFANAVKPLMPYKARIVNAIRRWIKKERDIAEQERRKINAAAEAAKKSEQDAENWLDSVLKNR